MNPPSSNSNPYTDIIHLSRPVIKHHPPMSRDARAAQFAPYAALVGHKELVQKVEAENTFAEPEIIPEYDDYDSQELDRSYDDPT